MAKEQGEKDELKGIEKSLHEFAIAASALKEDGKGLEFLVGDVDAIVERLKAINEKIAARRPKPGITVTTDRFGNRVELNTPDSLLTQKEIRRREELRLEEEESRRRQP